MGRKVEILQIIPADGWYSKYKVKEGTMTVPLACWTLFRDADGETFIGGVTAADIEDGDWTAENTSNFIGYTNYAGEGG